MLAITPQQDDTCLAPWTSDPEAKAILASFAMRPIQKTRLFNTFVQTRDEWTAYTGTSVERLQEIYNRHFLRMEAASIAHDCPAVMDAFLSEPTVEQAIDAACARDLARCKRNAGARFRRHLRLVGEA